MLALDEAVARLQAEAPQLAGYYTGLSMEEAAGVVGRSLSTLTREWRQARAWLAGHLR